MSYTPFCTRGVYRRSCRLRGREAGLFAPVFAASLAAGCISGVIVHETSLSIYFCPPWCCSWCRYVYRGAYGKVREETSGPMFACCKLCKGRKLPVSCTRISVLRVSFRRARVRGPARNVRPHCSGGRRGGRVDGERSAPDVVFSSYSALHRLLGYFRVYGQACGCCSRSMQSLGL
jgi:hypothetical protein